MTDRAVFPCGTRSANLPEAMNEEPSQPPVEPTTTTGVENMHNIRLTLAYDGGKFCGWQVQTNGPTIQAELERAIRDLTGEKVSVYSAGRTDSGVHALGQVANFHTTSPIPPEQFRPALQTRLPPEIVLLDSRLAPPGVSCDVLGAAEAVSLSD